MSFSTSDYGAQYGSLPLLEMGRHSSRSSRPGSKATASTENPTKAYRSNTGVTRQADATPRMSRQGLSHDIESDRQRHSRRENHQQPRSSRRGEIDLFDIFDACLIFEALGTLVPPEPPVPGPRKKQIAKEVEDAGRQHQKAGLVNEPRSLDTSPSPQRSSKQPLPRFESGVIEGIGFWEPSSRRSRTTKVTRDEESQKVSQCEEHNSTIEQRELLDRSPSFRHGSGEEWSSVGTGTGVTMQNDLTHRFRKPQTIRSNRGVEFKGKSE